MKRKAYETPVSEMLVMGAEDVVTASYIEGTGGDFVSEGSLHGYVDGGFTQNRLWEIILTRPGR